MATIGTFTKDDAGNYNGAIKTLTLNVKSAVLRKACLLYTSDAADE